MGGTGKERIGGEYRGRREGGVGWGGGDASLAYGGMDVMYGPWSCLHDLSHMLLLIAIQ